MGSFYETDLEFMQFGRESGEMRTSQRIQGSVYRADVAGERGGHHRGRIPLTDTTISVTPTTRIASVEMDGLTSLEFPFLFSHDLLCSGLLALSCPSPSRRKQQGRRWKKKKKKKNV